MSQSGQVVAWGDNQEGQLGLGDRDNRTVPHNVPHFEGAYMIQSGGCKFTVALMQGRFGVDMWQQHVRNARSRRHRVADSADDCPAFGKAGFKVACGYAHFAVLLNDGSVYTCGHNGYGQLGISDRHDRHEPTRVLSGVRDIACGDFHTAVLMNDGTLRTFGFHRVSDDDDDSANKLLISCLGPSTYYVTADGKIGVQ